VGTASVMRNEWYGGTGRGASKARWGLRGTYRKKVVIKQNDCVEVDGRIFVVPDDQSFSLEGGFYKCLMQRLEGPTDQQVANMKVDQAIKDDY